MKNTEVIKVLSNLIKCKSITPNDDSCQTYIGGYLKQLGFNIYLKKYGDVSNIIAKKGSSGPVIAFVGHTDVVPTGDIDQWFSNPFELTELKGKLYGRGTSDMKGSVACMMLAIKKFLEENSSHDGTIMMILTSDEEGDAINGIQKLVSNNDLKEHNIDMCLIGEPASKNKLGDTIKNGRRGSLSGTIVIKGVQGHIAYPHNAKNPIHLFAPILDKLVNQEYDKGNDYFPPTSFQISNVNSGVGTGNIIPGELTFDFNFRYSPESTKEILQKNVKDILDNSGADYGVEWYHSGEPYLTTEKKLLNACIDSIDSVLGIKPSVSTDGGTSDGRFMAKICNEIIEFGLINESIHKINEYTTEQDLNDLINIYKKLLNKILT